MAVSVQDIFEGCISQLFGYKNLATYLSGGSASQGAKY